MKYTKAFGTELLNDIKKVVKIIEFSVQGIYVAYLVYAMVISFGQWTFWVNSFLLVASVSYLAFTSIMEIKKSNNAEIRKNAKKIYSVTKKIIHIPTIITAIFTLHNLENDNITISLLITLAVIFSYIVYISSIMVEKVATTRINRLLVALDADMESMLSVINKIRRISGNEALSFGGNDESGEIRAALEKIASENKAIEDEEKLIKKQQRAINRKAFAKEDREYIKTVFKTGFEKAKSKLSALASKKQTSISAPDTYETKDPIEK